VVFNGAMLAQLLAVSAGAMLAYALALWALSLPLHDVSIVDPGWGLGFVIVAWLAFALGEGCVSRRALLAGLVSIWGLRLAGHLIARKLSERREDPRYADMRRRHGARFALVSLGSVFLTQALLIWIVSLPLQASAPETDRLGALDGVGIAAWALGFLFEAVGDRQLSRFRADASNRGRVMDRGLWRYTRHPNYFGDFMVWWGVWLIALSTVGAWWTVVGPLVMSTLLIRVSGKGLLEQRMSARPGYREYASRTSGFVPLPPRGRSR
jgi:steroid 5-alpha reductase family enzyme